MGNMISGILSGGGGGGSMQLAFVLYSSSFGQVEEVAAALATSLAVFCQEAAVVGTVHEV